MSFGFQRSMMDSKIDIFIRGKMKRFVALIFTLSIFTLNIHAQIHQVKTMDQVSKHLQVADNNTLAIFDIDMVLTQPEDPAFQMKNMKLYRHVVKKIFHDLPPEKVEIFLTLMTLCSPSILVDVKTPQLLQDLGQRQIPSMALTANLTGKVHSVESMETWKIENLRGCGIDFSRSPIHDQTLIFKDLPSFRNNFVTFKEGILFTNGVLCSKGEALVAFLTKTGIHPETVVFVDDREENLKSVEEFLEQYDPDIDYVGLHYLGAQDYPSECISEKEFESRWIALAHLAKTVR